MKKTRFQRERGATVVLMALGMIGLLAFGGLVIDGGNAFSQRRQMQNTSDAAATAGANALYKYHSFRANNSAASCTAATCPDIYQAALQVATANNADEAPNLFECWLLPSPGALQNKQPCLNAQPSVKDASWTVVVGVNEDYGTRLIRVVGIDSFTAAADAEASLLTGELGQGLFLMCGYGLNAQSPKLLLDDPTVPSNPYKINELAIGTIYDIWDNKQTKLDQDCGVNGFKGLAENPQNSTIPGNWTDEQGDKAGHTVGQAGVDAVALTDQPCPLTADTKYMDIAGLNPPCEFLIPLCVGSNVNGAGKKVLYCVKVGRFVVTGGDNNEVQARFLGGGLLSSGTAGGVPTSNADTMIIKITE